MEESVNQDEMFKEQDSVELVENPLILNEEEGRAAAIIYFKKYKDSSLEEILGHMGHWQNKWTLLIAHANDLENKINETELGGIVEKDEMKGLLSKLMKASKEIDKVIHHPHVAYELYHKKGHYKDEPANKCNKKIPAEKHSQFSRY
eukprot:15349464-Ditylum_brightwellii.AAC.1